MRNLSEAVPTFSQEYEAQWSAVSKKVFANITSYVSSPAPFISCYKEETKPDLNTELYQGIASALYRKFKEVFSFFDGINVGISGSRVTSEIYQFFHGEPLSECSNADIDLYFMSEQDRQSAKSLLKIDNGKAVVSDRYFVTDVRFPWGEYDLIHFPQFNTFELMLNNYDIIANATMITKECAYFLENSIFDVKEKKISIHRVGNPDKTLSRMLKYSKKGFSTDSNEIGVFMSKIRNSNAAGKNKTYLHTKGDTVTPERFVYKIPINMVKASSISNNVFDKSFKYLDI